MSPSNHRPMVQTVGAAFCHCNLAVDVGPRYICRFAIWVGILPSSRSFRSKRLAVGYLGAGYWVFRLFQYVITELHVSSYTDIQPLLSSSYLTRPPKSSGPTMKQRPNLLNVYERTRKVSNPPNGVLNKPGRSSKIHTPTAFSSWLYSKR
jgi:hypothetical protein